MAVTDAGRHRPAGKRAIKVVMGYAEALAAPESAWSLVDAGFDVTLFARRGSHAALRRSRSVRIVDVTPPEKDAEGAATDLAALTQTLRADALMPLDDSAVWTCAAVAPRVSAVVVGPTGHHARVALDKRLQLDAAIAAGFSVPATRVITSVGDALSLDQFPVVLKPALAVSIRDGELQRGSGNVCATPAELRRVIESWAEREPLLAQPLLVGAGEGVFGLAGPRGVDAWSAHKRVRMMNPQGSGSSACTNVPLDTAVTEQCAQMLTALRWDSLFMVELLRTADGDAWFMELNGRPWGSMALARRLGLEYPAWAVKRALDPGFQPDVQGANGAVVCRHLGREIVHLLMVLRGPRSSALVQWPSRAQTLRDVLRADRSERWYNWRAGERTVFLADTLGTVAAEVSKKWT